MKFQSFQSEFAVDIKDMNMVDHCFGSLKIDLENTWRIKISIPAMKGLVNIQNIMNNNDMSMTTKVKTGCSRSLHICRDNLK